MQGSAHCHAISKAFMVIGLCFMPFSLCSDMPLVAGKSVQQPWASPGNPGCSHENITVTAGKTYRVRIINGGSLLYQTVCFEGHNVTIIAGDATPTEPISFGPCVDINSGQRCNTALLSTFCICSINSGQRCNTALLQTFGMCSVSCSCCSD